MKIIAMTTVERKQAIADAQSRAKSLAEEYIKRGKASGASEADKTYGETARLVIENAEAMAELFPRSELERRLAEAESWTDEQEARITEIMEAEAAKGVTDFSTGTVKEEVDHMVAVLDVKQSELMAWVVDHALRAWLDAYDRLIAFGKLGSLIKSPEQIQ